MLAPWLLLCFLPLVLLPLLPVGHVSPTFSQSVPSGLRTDSPQSRRGRGGGARLGVCVYCPWLLFEGLEGAAVGH
jgi:hypothetical protein